MNERFALTWEFFFVFFMHAWYGMNKCANTLMYEHAAAELIWMTLIYNVRFAFIWSIHGWFAFVWSINGWLAWILVNKWMIFIIHEDFSAWVLKQGCKNKKRTTALLRGNKAAKHILDTTHGDTNNFLSHTWLRVGNSSASVRAEKKTIIENCNLYHPML